MAKPTVLVTGVSGNLGRRLLEQLSGYSVVGVDVTPPAVSTVPLDHFVPLDLGKEESTRELHVLLRELHPVAVIHLAFVLDPQRTGVLDVNRMWQINVAGTARVMEAITEANRIAGAMVRQFIFPGSVSAYGPDLPSAVTKTRLCWRTRCPTQSTRKKATWWCSSGLLRCVVAASLFCVRIFFAGATVDNYLMGAFGGTPNGKGQRAARMRKQGKRLPCILPYGQEYMDNQLQFVHVDDMARLIVWMLKREPEAQRLTILNVAGRESLFHWPGVFKLPTPK